MFLPTLLQASQELLHDMPQIMQALEWTQSNGIC